MRKVLMSDEATTMKNMPPHTISLASIATLTERPEVEGQISESNLKRGRSFQKTSSLKASFEKTTHLRDRIPNAFFCENTVQMRRISFKQNNLKRIVLSKSHLLYNVELPGQKSS
jgi:hypothetical protein